MGSPSDSFPDGCSTSGGFDGSEVNSLISTDESTRPPLEPGAFLAVGRAEPEWRSSCGKSVSPRDFRSTAVVQPTGPCCRGGEGGWNGRRKASRCVVLPEASDLL